MTQTFTSQIHETAIKTQKVQSELPDADSYRHAEPSKNVLDNILNFSKNLELKKSGFVDFIEVMKS